MDDIAAEALSHALDGLIVSNTTLSRDGLKDQRQAKEAGGLSGKPLFDKSTAVLREDAQACRPERCRSSASAACRRRKRRWRRSRRAPISYSFIPAWSMKGRDCLATIVRGLSKLLDREQVEIDPRPER